MSADAHETSRHRQYLAVKESLATELPFLENLNAILFYRNGQSYELYLEDAEIAAQCLGLEICLDPHLKVPMVTFPVSGSEELCSKLIVAGHGVAWCDMLDDGKPFLWRASRPATDW